MSRRPKVVLLMRKAMPGYYSIERLFESLAPLLSSHFDVEIVRVPCHSSGFLRCLRNLIFTARLRADIIHVTGDIYYCALGTRRRQCVLTIHDLCSRNRLKGVRKRMLSLFWYALPLRWSLNVTAISRETIRQLEESHPSSAGKVLLIPNCVDEIFKRDRPVQTSARKPQVLQIGTGENKNLKRVASAFSGLSVHLRIIGRLSPFQRHFLASADLEWTSADQLSTEELIMEYLDSDVLVFVSTYEGFGLPIVEAQAIGLPVITSTIPPMVDTAGSGALLVDPYDERQIRAALIQILDSDNLRNRLTNAGKLNAERFGASIIARQYVDVYSRMLKSIRDFDERT